MEADPAEAMRRLRLRRAVAEAGVEDALQAAGFLRACLRAKKQDPVKAAALVQGYGSFRQKHGWIPGSVSASDLRAELRTSFNMLLPYPDVYGQTVVTQSMSLLDLSLRGTSMERYQKCGYYLLHRALQEPRTQTCGIALLIDFQGFAFGSVLRHVRVSDLRRGVHMLQDCSPAHLNALYVLNPPRWIERLLGMLRPLLRRDTLQKKLFLLGQGELSMHFDAAQLPTQLGGSLAFDWRERVAEWEVEEAARGATFDVSSFVSEVGDNGGSTGTGT